MGKLFSSKKKSKSSFEQSSTSQNQQQQRSGVETPEYFEDLLQRYITRAESTFTDPFTSYEGDRFADFTQDELDAMQLIRDSVGASDNLFDSASTFALDAASQFRAPDQVALDAYINPYTTNVLDNAQERLKEAFEEQQVRLRSGTGSAYGGARMGVLEAQSLDDYLQQSGDLQFRGLSEAYDRALDNRFRDAGALFDSALGLQNLGTAQTSERLREAGALGQIGTQQRELEQADRDFDFSEFIREITQDESDVLNMGNVISAFPRDLFSRFQESEGTTTSQARGTETSTQTSTPSPFDIARQVGGLFSLGAGGVGSAFGGAGGFGSAAASLVPQSVMGQGGRIMGGFSGVRPGEVTVNPFSYSSVQRFKEGGLVKKFQEGGSVNRSPVGAAYLRKLRRDENKDINIDLSPIRDQLESVYEDTLIVDYLKNNDMLDKSAIKALSNIDLEDEKQKIQDLYEESFISEWTDGYTPIGAQYLRKVKRDGRKPKDLNIFKDLDLGLDSNLDKLKDQIKKIPKPDLKQIKDNLPEVELFNQEKFLEAVKSDGNYRMPNFPSMPNLPEVELFNREKFLEAVKSDGNYRMPSRPAPAEREVNEGSGFFEPGTIRSALKNIDNMRKKARDPDSSQSEVEVNPFDIAIRQMGRGAKDFVTGLPDRRFNKERLQKAANIFRVPLERYATEDSSFYGPNSLNYQRKLQEIPSKTNPQEIPSGTNTEFEESLNMMIREQEPSIAKERITKAVDNPAARAVVENRNPFTLPSPSIKPRATMSGEYLAPGMEPTPGALNLEPSTRQTQQPQQPRQRRRSNEDFTTRWLNNPLTKIGIALMNEQGISAGMRDLREDEQGQEAMREARRVGEIERADRLKQAQIQNEINRLNAETQATFAQQAPQRLKLDIEQFNQKQTQQNREKLAQTLTQVGKFYDPTGKTTLDPTANPEKAAKFYKAAARVMSEGEVAGGFKGELNNLLKGIENPDPNPNPVSDRPSNIPEGVTVIDASDL